MRGQWRCFGPIAAATVMIAPIGEATIALLLAVALNLAIVAVIGRDLRQWRLAVARRAEEAALLLRRRTVPQLRSRRPFGVVEEQVRWRHAAEGHRSRREGPLSVG